MTDKEIPHDPQPDSLHIRPDVVRMFRDRPFVTFEELYDQLTAAAAEDMKLILKDVFRYSDDNNQRTAFAAGVLHVLRIQQVSREFDELEASLRLSLLTDDGGDVDQLHSDELDDDPPAA